MFKILVTGSSGFIGQHLYHYLQSCGYTVIAADIKDGIDLTQEQVVKNLPDVDVVIHLAAYNGTKHFYDKPFDVIRNSILPTQYLLERYSGKVKRFIFAGTCESYAGAVDLFDWPVPTDETVPLVVSDVKNPRWSYGGSKIVNELQVIAAHEQLGQEYTIIRYHNVFGPNQVDHFIPEFIDRAKNGDYVLRGYLNTRSFMYIEDALEATRLIIESDKIKNQIINVGNDKEIKILDVANIILDLMKIKSPLILYPEPLGSVKRRCPDIKKLRSLGFRSKITLLQGLMKVMESQCKLE